MSHNKPIIVGVSGASGAVLALRFVEKLKAEGKQVHLIMSTVAKQILVHETGVQPDELIAMADTYYENHDLFAAVASGTFQTQGMVIIPCSVKSLSAIATGYADCLINRAADVTLKERRKLVLVMRETPLNLIHLDNMKKATQAGALILPPVLSFYNQPKSIDDMVDHICGKVLDALDVEHDTMKRWS